MNNVVYIISGNNNYDFPPPITKHSLGGYILEYNVHTRIECQNSNSLNFFDTIIFSTYKDVLQ